MDREFLHIHLRWIQHSWIDMDTSRMHEKAAFLVTRGTVWSGISSLRAEVWHLKKANSASSEYLVSWTQPKAHTLARNMAVCIASVLVNASFQILLLTRIIRMWWFVHVTWIWRNFTAKGLKGPMPSLISQLVHLEELTLDDNRIEDPIPSEIGRLIHLRRLSLNNNSLTSLPPEELLMCNLTYL